LDVGVAAAWLQRALPAAAPGSWLLDPFGAAPQIAIELARAGYRVLVAANNPVARCLIELAANPPNTAELQAALAELATAARGDERIEPHIRGLYQTTCAACGQKIMAEAFLWSHDPAISPAPVLVGRLYHCPHCNDSGERPITPEDENRAAQMAANTLHRARALERVAPLHDPSRADAVEALAVYLPRAVYALFTLINKVDGLALPARKKELLRALLLSACDQGNVLWRHPSGQARPRQLSIPNKFREHNLWLALEHAVDQWASTQPAIPLTIWPALPPASGGLCLFEGRLKDLGAALRTPSIAPLELCAAAAALPRPNQAYWTLSALWAGWLWGPEAVGPFKSVLHRRRYDWAWHTAALSAAFGHLAPLLAPGAPCLGLVAEAEAGFLSAALTAADHAGLALAGLALRAGANVESGQAQIEWRATGAPPPEPAPGANLEATAAPGIAGFLAARGEPASHLLVHSAGLSALAQAQLLHAAAELRPRPAASAAPTAAEEEPKPAETFGQVQAVMREVLSYRGGFLRYGAGEAPETGQWWLRTSEQVPTPLAPLADRVEMAVVPYLQRHPGLTWAELDQAICQAFPGLLTPEAELIRLCLESYGLQDPPESGRWQLRPEDQPPARRADLETMSALAVQLGARLGFSTPAERPPGAPLAWFDTLGQRQRVLYLSASGVLGKLVLDSAIPASQGLIVLPGGRANLVAYKLRRDPHLAQAVAAGWRFVKYRHLRYLLETPLLTPATLDDLLAQDPLTFAASQMRLF
jgi:hypothetical protein